ncbi:MAG: hypothetical protein RLZZ301_1537 [Bacteroidota bacterium]|jgi:predicted O-methyltransferase YrrM
MMGKIQKFFKGLFMLAKQPSLLNLILKNEDYLKAQFYKRYPQLQLQEIDVFSWPEATDIRIAPYAFLSGSSYATDFALLQLICRQFHVKSYFEIGTWRGESAAAVAPYVNEVFTLNLPDERLRAMGQSEAYISSHRFFSSSFPNVTHLFADSAEIDLAPYRGQMDCIFIDGDHSAEAVERDTKRMLPLRKNEQSILIWHDAKSDAEYPRYEVLMGIYNAMPPALHAHIYLVKHSLCAVYLPKGHPSQPIAINALPTRAFEFQLRSIEVSDLKSL